MRIGTLGSDEAFTARVDLIPARALDAALTATWEEIRASNPDLQSPFFSAKFARIVASVRGGVEIAVVATDGKIVALFPFLRKPGHPLRAVPVGDFICDFAGMICPPGFTCDPRELLRECGLARFDYHHLLGSQTFFAPSETSREESAQIDLRLGYEHYVADRRAEGSSLVKSCANLARRMERELGPIRFVPDCRASAALREVMALKTAQYSQTGVRDLFAIPWVRDAIASMHESQGEGFAGVLSLLSAGDRLVAGHFGIRSKTVWHYFFPAYDVSAAKYSPGLNLLLRMAEHAPSIGIETIDLGKARAAYKRRVMNRTVVIADGRVDGRPPGALARLAWGAKSVIARAF